MRKYDSMKVWKYEDEEQKSRTEPLASYELE